MIIQLLALGSLGIIAWIDIKYREIPILLFIAGLLVTGAAGLLLEGTIFLIYLAIFGGLFTIGGLLGVRGGAWYYGEALAMPILAAGTYGIHMLWFFIYFTLIIPGTAYALRRSELYEEKDEPLLPAFFLVLLLAWLSSLAL